MLLVLATWICVGTVVLQILFRFVFSISVPWTEEVARLAFVWVCWIACGYAMVDNSHIDINLMDSLYNKLKNPEKAFRVARNILLIVSIIFLFAFLHIYWQFYNTVLHGVESSVALHIPASIPTASLIVGCVLMILHGLYNLIPQKLREK